MLVLTRGRGESIFIGDDIEIQVINIKEHSVRIGIEAPKDVQIIRDDAKKKSPKVVRE